MIEKPKRPKQPSIQERQPPRTLQELINRYDLDNTKIYDFLDELVNQVNKEQDNIRNYSNNEVEIGTWYDGRKMYRKLLNFRLTGSANVTNSQDIDLSSWGITAICSIKGTEYYGVGGAFPYPYYTSNTDFGVCYFNMSNKTLTIRYQYNNATGRYLVIEIVYLKE